MRNQPKYNFFKNWSYALAGFFEVLKTEKALKIELIIFSGLLIWLWFLNLTLGEKLVLALCFPLVVITEMLNSAIERTVDLVTLEFHPLAKSAKDAAAAAVMLANFTVVAVWLTVLIKLFI